MRRLLLLAFAVLIVIEALWGLPVRGAAAELRPMPRPAQRVILVAACGPEVADGAPAVILGDDGDGVPRFSILLDNAGLWQLVATLLDGSLCPIGSGTFFGVSQQITTKPGEEA